jgi:hypothetical protein
MKELLNVLLALVPGKEYKNKVGFLIGLLIGAVIFFGVRSLGHPVFLDEPSKVYLLNCPDDQDEELVGLGYHMIPWECSVITYSKDRTYDTNVGTTYPYPLSPEKCELVSIEGTTAREICGESIDTPYNIR